MLSERSADNTACLVHEADHLAHIRLADKVDHAVKRRMNMSAAGFAALDELDFALKVVYYLLKPVRVRPFRREIRLSPGDDNPELGGKYARDFFHLRHPGFFLVG